MKERGEEATAGGWRCHPEIEARWDDFEKLLDQLTKGHKIDDRPGLGRAVDVAMRIDRGRGALREDDVKLLKESLPKVTKVWSRGDNETRIANILMYRDDLLIYGGAWSWERATGVAVLVSQIGRCLSALEVILRQSRRGKAPDARFHGAVASLERYWGSLGRGNYGRTKFIEMVMNFIRPPAGPGEQVAAKVKSAVRHRLKREVAK